MQQRIKKDKVNFEVDGNEEFWRVFEDNSWEPETFKILDKAIKPHYVVADIGAWIGPITLYLAAKSKYCFSFEPDPAAFKELTRNVSINPGLANKIKLYNKAISGQGKPVTLFSRFEYGDSGSSILKRTKSTNNSVSVESMVFQDFVKENKIEKIDFIKMDIEGGEFVVLPRMVAFLKEHQPSLLVSLHFTALCEFLELKYFRWGWTRRICRLLDRDNKFLKKKANEKIEKLIDSLRFYKIYDKDLKPLAAVNSFDRIDILFFSKDEMSVF